MKKLLCVVSLLLLLCMLPACTRRLPENKLPHTHTYGDWFLDPAPTCTTIGVYKKVCTCGAEITDREKLCPPVHHDYDANGICSMCNRSETEIRLEGMEPVIENEYGTLYLRKGADEIAYYSAQTGKTLFSKPQYTDYSTTPAHVGLTLDATLIEDDEPGGLFQANSVLNSTLVTSTEGGVLTLTYTFSYTFALPEMILRSDMEESVFAPASLSLGGYTTPEFEKFSSFYKEVFYASTTDEQERLAIAAQYPAIAEKNIDVYVLDKDASFMERYYVEQALKEHAHYSQAKLTQNNMHLELERQPYEFATVTLTIALTEQGLLIHWDDTLCATIGEDIVDSLQLLPHLMAQSAPDITLAPKDPGPG